VERLDALGDDELRRTLLFVRAEGRPVSADGVGRALEAPRTAARWRLERLVDAGLLVSHFERRSGRGGPGAGRPAKLYAAAPETMPVEFPRRRSETLVALLMRAIPERRRARELRDVGMAFGEELARSAGIRRTAAPVSKGLERVSRGLGALGFDASVESVTSGQAVIRSATCPLRPLVVADAGAREIDVGMWRGLVEAAVGASAVACSTHGCRDDAAACRIVVSLAAPAS
jgi:predicted ArsR family transcriptional regulator